MSSEAALVQTGGGCTDEVGSVPQSCGSLGFKGLQGVGFAGFWLQGLAFRVWAVGV